MEYQEKQEELLHSLLNRSYEIDSNETDTHLAPAQFQDNLLIDEEDRLCVMHRDAHFGSSFDEMLRYYREEKKGAVLDIPLKRIESLREKEKSLGADIAPLLLSGSDAEKIQLAKKLYQELRTLFERGSEEKIVKEIVALILSEEEEYENDIDAILCIGKPIIPYLIEVVQSQTFKDPLFPGYGKAPLSAAYALGKLRAEEAIIALFELLCENPDEYEEVATGALTRIGKKAAEFLMRQVCKKPITSVNEQAATVLLAFEAEDTAVAVAELFFSMLQDKEIIKIVPFACYLALGCEKLAPKLREDFKKLLSDPNTPGQVKEEIKLLSKEWDKK